MKRSLAFLVALELAVAASCSDSTPALKDGAVDHPRGDATGDTSSLSDHSADSYIPFDWATSLGGSDDDEAGYVAIDPAGNMYLTASFVGTMTLGSTTLSGKGVTDVLVAKYSPAGELLWAVSGGGAGDDVPMGIAVDGTGNAYVVGTYNANATYGEKTIKPNGGYDGFVIRVSQDGQFTAALTMGAAKDDVLYAVATDPSSGNAYATGYFYGEASFGSTKLTSNGMCDAILAVVGPDGTYQKVIRAGGEGWDRGFAVAVSATGDVYWTGQYAAKDLVIGSTSLAIKGEADIFVAKISASGQVQWATAAYGQSQKEGKALGIAVDAAGNSYVTGQFEGDQYTFGPANLTSKGLIDGFVAKVSSAGQFEWATPFGGAGNDSGDAIAIDSAGSLHVVGYFAETMSLDAAATPALTLTSKGGSDAFVARFSPQGAAQWATGAGGTGLDEAQMIVLDSRQYAYISGYFQSSATFGTHSLSAKGKKDLFLWRMPLSN